jgi:multimeric flavodoxin WrbA
MFMKIVGLVGSPRKNGNTDALLQKAMQGAKAQGAETTLFYLNDLNLRGCQACYTCKKTGKCAVNDDMTGIYRAIDEADAVIIGSPIYFGRFTSQLAPVMDRLFAYLKPDFTSSLAKGKKFGLVFTYNQPDPTLYSACINSVAQVFGRLGFEAGPKPLVRAGLGDPDAALKNEQYLQAAFALGKELASR